MQYVYPTLEEWDVVILNPKNPSADLLVAIREEREFGQEKVKRPKARFDFGQSSDMPSGWFGSKRERWVYRA